MATNIIAARLDDPARASAIDAIHHGIEDSLDATITSVEHYLGAGSTTDLVDARHHLHNALNLTDALEHFGLG